MRDDYPQWLETQYEPNTQIAQMNRVRRIEGAYGSLDDHVQNSTIASVLNELQYSTADERSARPNPSKIQIDGNLRKNLASYKDAVKRYLRFLQDDQPAYGEAPVPEISEQVDAVLEQKFSLERDMQQALRKRITSLDPALEIIDDGAERYVDSGRIDITCKDEHGLVVIELKAGIADGKAIGQILGYMGDLHQEEELPTRGILVAHDFDKRARSAALVVPTLTLMRYSIEFKFTELGD